MPAGRIIHQDKTIWHFFFSDVTEESFSCFFCTSGVKVSVKSLRVVTVKYRLDYNACLLFLVNTAILDQRLSARIDSLKTAGIGTKERINIIKISQSFQNSLGFRRSLYLLTSRFNQEIISKSHPRALLKKKISVSSCGLLALLAADDSEAGSISIHCGRFSSQGMR